MWPIWLIVAVAVIGAITLSTAAVLVVIQVERKRHHSIISQICRGLGRNSSRHRQPHLSINDVDFVNLPQLELESRQSVQASHKDSRFYSVMSFEDNISVFPEASGESLADTNYVHTNTNRSHYWLIPTKSDKSEKRKKKTIQLSVSAPMARSPMSAIVEQPESVRQESPEPVELPAQTTPKFTPDQLATAEESVPIRSIHIMPELMDGVVVDLRSDVERVLTQSSHSNTTRSRKIGSGMASPPNCPLPPVPEVNLTFQAQLPDSLHSTSGFSTAHYDMTLLNSALMTKGDAHKTVVGSTLTAVKPSANIFSDFNFGLSKDDLQIVTVDEDEPRYHQQIRTQTAGPLSIYLASRQPSPIKYQVNSLSPRDHGEWNLLVGLRPSSHEASSLQSRNNASQSRSVSGVPLVDGAGPLSSHRPSPSTSDSDNESRDVSVSSSTFSRHSAMDSTVSVPSCESPRTRGHRRQNCIRISVLTPVEKAKKRPSSQLHRLAEAEETDVSDATSTGIGITTMKSTRSVSSSNHAKTGPVEHNLDITKFRRPHTSSLRVKPPGLLCRDKSLFLTSSETHNHDILSASTLTAPPRPSNTVAQSKSNQDQDNFVYAGSPASDPTRLYLKQQEYSPVSPSPSVKVTSPPASPATKLTRTVHDMAITFAPHSTKIVSANQSSRWRESLISGKHDSVNRRTTTLHGPRDAPPPSLRTRNRNYAPPIQRLTPDKMNSSPIRKTTQSKTPGYDALLSLRRCSNSVHDELHRKTALLHSLTHAATVGKAGGLPGVNLIRASPVPSSSIGVCRTPRSDHEESPRIESPDTKSTTLRRGPRQRSITVMGHALNPPQVPQEQTYPCLKSPPGLLRFSNSPSNVSVWEDASARSDSEIESPRAKGQLQPPEKHMHRRSKTLTPASTTTSRLEKEPTWKLQQSTDAIMSRALAFSDICNPAATNLVGPNLKPSNGKERKVMMLDNFWGDKSQAQSGGKEEEPTSQNLSQLCDVDSTAGSRLPYHTINAIPSQLQHDEMSVKMQEIVGLGLSFQWAGSKFGPTALAPVLSVTRSGSGGPRFLNEMERDSIGKLR